MGAYDAGRRRRSVRRGRERGCWVYIPQEELAKAAYDGPAPWYRVWGSSVRGSRVTVNLYPEP